MINVDDISTACNCYCCRNFEQAREDSACAEMFVTDNLQYANLVTSLEDYGKSSLFCRWQNDSPKTQITNTGEHFVLYQDDKVFADGADHCLQVDEWTDLDWRAYAKLNGEWPDLEQIKAKTHAELREKMQARGQVHLLDSVERHPRPQAFEGVIQSNEERRAVPGFLNVSEHEHERVVSWTPNLATFPPPPNEGEMHSDHMSQKTKRRVNRVGDWIVWRHSSLGFLTLTLDRHVCDKIAKNWLKLLIKRAARSEIVKLFDYVWCAERTKAGVLHFHLLFAGWIPQDWINENWTDLAGSRGPNGWGPVKPLFPNIKKAHGSSVGYMTKYMGKADRCRINGRRWGASSDALRCSMPVGGRSTEMTWDEFCEHAEQADADVVYRNGFLQKFPKPSKKKT